MAPLSLPIVGGIFAAAVVLALVMDQVKVWLFRRFRCLARHAALVAATGLLNCSKASMAWLAYITDGPAPM